MNSCLKFISEIKEGDHFVYTYELSEDLYNSLVDKYGKTEFEDDLSRDIVDFINDKYNNFKLDMKEILKLKYLLEKDNIPFEYDVYPWVTSLCWQVYFPSKEDRQIDVIINDGSYGHENGLLELMDGSNDPIGYLTAEEALVYIKRRFEEY